MDKRHKDIMRMLIRKLRYTLVGTHSPTGFIPGSLDRELERIGIASDGTITPSDALLKNIRNGELRAYRVATAILMPLPEEQRSEVRSEIIERAAYTWINRLLALRAMEVRQLIYSTLRGKEDYEGLSEKLYFLRLEEPKRVANADGGWWAVLEDACDEQAKALPGLFALNDPSAALRPASAALVQCIELVNGSRPIEADITPDDLDAIFADPDAIGWAYQFYQEEAKARIDAKCKIGGKVASRSELAAKTELFTEPYMVQWLLQNSLGRSYHEANPRSNLPDTWEYYVKPEKLDTVIPCGLDNLTLLDPCMGSGHFLRFAFDMLVAMYRELHLSFTAKEIADSILSTHLFGIDLDPRAAQLAALTLYLRAWELVRDEQRKLRKFGPCVYIPPAMNLATTPVGLDKGALERHLQRTPQDRIFTKLLENIFTGLEQADMLGSLLRTREYLDSAVTELLKPQNFELEFDPDTIMRYQAITELAKINPAGLRNELLETIANSFKVEAGNADDVSVALFGHEAERGVRLLQMLDRQYAVVVTNPPYLGSAYMDDLIKRYIMEHYSSGKRDIYAAFILRCLELCRTDGRVAMVTMQSWMFLRHYAELRAMSEKKMIAANKKDEFAGLLRETSIEVLAHLGSRAFEEIEGEVVQSVMFTLTNCVPNKKHKIVAYRLVGIGTAKEKADMLRVHPAKISSNPYQAEFLEIPEAPVVYWLKSHFFQILKLGTRLKDVADVKRGLDTGNDMRFVRFWWEVTKHGWTTFSKGGGYSKWFGFDYYRVDWRNGNIRFSGTSGARIQNTRFYFHPFLTYSLMASGSLGVRFVGEDAIPSGAAGGIYPHKQDYRYLLCAFLNARVTSYMLRFVCPDLKFREGYVANIPELITSTNNLSISRLAKYCTQLKMHEISLNLIESSYSLENSFYQIKIKFNHIFVYQLLRHTIEGIIDKEVSNIYGVFAEDMEALLEETGIPVGWHPLVVGYDTLPSLPESINLPEIPKELLDHLTIHKHIALHDNEFVRLKAKLKTLYEAGPGAKGIEQEENEQISKDEEEEMASVAHIPIPPETFLEELSAKMELHPISVYWLLEELRAEGARCRPEEKRLLEDHLSVLVLRLLGHRWPKQIETEEAIPLWTDKHGIIPLVPGIGKPTLAEHVRERLRIEDGALATQQTEALLQELTGQNLEQWLRRSFFTSHVRQFKYRPLAWHLASKPVRGSSSAENKNSKRSLVTTSGGPAFECLLYYHVCAKGALARIRMHYIEPLLNAERSKIEQKESVPSGKTNAPETPFEPDDTNIVIAKLRIRELEDFAARLQKVEEEGYASSALQELLAGELLDRWSGDGYREPSGRDEFRRSEEAWHVDINDGVRVNIAPLQLAGVLVSDVLKPADAKKAIADRARWRADERHWVRDGKLPRCGWMDEQVPASEAWLEYAASRSAEQNGSKLQQLALQQEGLEV